MGHLGPEIDGDRNINIMCQHELVVYHAIQILNHIWAKKGGLLIELVANCSTIYI